MSAPAGGPLPGAPAPGSSYLEALPAVYREADEVGDRFLGRFLLAFEHVLHGLGDADVAGFPRGLGEQLSDAGRYLDPSRTPHEFLDWLAGWVALSLAEDWTEDEQRRFLARAVPLYRLRGTARGLTELLRAYTGDLPVTVYEFDNVPHYFQVELTLGLSLRDPDFEARKQRRQRTAMAIIDQQKPAHTFYSFRFRDVPTMQIRVHSTVGVDAVLGSVADPGKAG
ncbi:MAG: phage tail protein [Blastococcus sp.]|nr:phage tail protein [Blastococcus sp.]